MAKDDKKDNKILNEIKKEEDKVKVELDTLMKQTKGYGITTKEKIINPDITNLGLDNFGPNNINGIEETLFNAKGKDKYTQTRISDLMYAGMYSQDDKNFELEELMKPRMVKNLEYNYILNNMIEMTNAIDTLSEDVVFPNSALETGINITFKGNKDKSGEREADLIKFFRPKDDPLMSLRSRRLYNFDIEEMVKELVFNVATYGYQIAYTIPYKSIATDLLYQAEKEKDLITKANYNSTATLPFRRIGESFFIEEGGKKAFAESFYDLFERKSNSYNKPNENESKNALGISENFSSELFTHTPYSIKDIDEVTKYISESDDLFKEDYDKNLSAVKDTFGIGEGLGDNAFANILEDIKAKKQKKFIIDNIKGCTFEFLDINKCQPIFIKEELIGVYMVEPIPEASKYKLGNSLTNIINSSQIDDGLVLGDKYRKTIREVVFKDLENVLRRNIDKAFIRNNPNLIEDIEWILDAQGLDNILENRIRFIPAEYLTFFKNGPGLLGQSMLDKTKTYAMMHIQLNKSEALNKVFLNKNRLKVSVHDTGSLDSQVTIDKAIRNVRNAAPRLTDVGIPDTMTDSLLANYQTIVVQKNKNGDEGYDIDSIPLQEPKDNSEYLRYLRNQATLGLGYPADLLDPSQNLDFAKKISQINLRTLSKIVAMQNSLTLPLSELCTKRLRYMTGLEAVEVEVKFSKPKELDDNTTLEGLEKVQRKVEMYELLIDNNVAIKDEEKIIMKAKLAKKLLAEYLDMNILEEMANDTIIEGTEL